MLKQIKELTDAQDFIRIWLEQINETDELQIKEVMDLMRLNSEYRKFIIDYTREKL